MKALVTGVKGQLGHDVMNELAKRGYEGVGVDVEEMDITDAAAVDSVIREAKVDSVVHCAAWTAVDAAEDNEEMAVKTIQEIYARIENIQQFPYMGADLAKRVSFRTDYKYVICGNYVVLYKIGEEYVEIYRVVNRYQDITKIFL